MYSDLHEQYFQATAASLEKFSFIFETNFQTVLFENDFKAIFPELLLTLSTRTWRTACAASSSSRSSDSACGSASARGCAAATGSVRPTLASFAARRWSYSFRTACSRSTGWDAGCLHHSAVK